jgi:hypothetical protein
MHDICFQQKAFWDGDSSSGNGLGLQVATCRHSLLAGATLVLCFQQGSSVCLAVCWVQLGVIVVRLGIKDRP